MKKAASFLTAAVIMTSAAAAYTTPADAALDLTGTVEYNGFVYHYHVLDTENNTAELNSGEELHGSITLPSELDGFKIIRINSEAFFGNVDIQEITVPDSVTDIGEGAFSGCLSLRRITLGKNTETIGKDCFTSCTSLIRADLGSALTEIPERCFFSCTSLKYADIPYSVTSVCDEAYFGCVDMPSLRIPPNVTDIADNAIGMHYDVVNKRSEAIKGFKITGLKNTIAQHYAKGLGLEFKEDFGNISGDANLDGKITTADASKVLSECASLANKNIPSFSLLQHENADISLDGKITTTDAALVLKKCAELSKPVK